MPWSFGYSSYSLHFDGSAIAAEETEFLLAVAAYQKRYRRRYPTWREVLHVARCLGYRKVAEPVPLSAPQPPSDEGEKSEVRGQQGTPGGLTSDL